jgi:ubiquinol-cytochrome c reductase cytochrome c1 subunit
MIRALVLAAAALMGLSLAGPAAAQEEHATPEIQRQSWTFAGPFGTFDRNQLQRGFQVFNEVCANCHEARLLAFRNLSERGGPEFSEGQVKALAASKTITDPDVESGTRPGVAADRWPKLYPTEADARAAFQGAAPPDLSVMAKARSITTPFPWWILNYITGYSEGGPDYIFALMNGYHEGVPPHAPPNEDGTPFQLPEGKFYNDVFPGHAIGMTPPLPNDAVDYEGDDFPQTTEQYARDVSAFLMWLSEPHLVARKEAGLRVILFLVLFAGLMWFVKEKLWGPIHHNNPSPDELEAERAGQVAAPVREKA